MAYARWSNADYACDVYVYESRDGWVTHVASFRLQSDRPCPPMPAGWSGATVDEIQAALDAQREWLEGCWRVAIELPEAGESFLHSTPGECAANLTRLAALGYMVPEDCIAALEAEQEELDGG